MKKIIPLVLAVSTVLLFVVAITPADNSLPPLPVKGIVKLS
ncbi:hypothetical protein [Alicyclobacillus sp. ALC3]|nr:hypothetical protein [Alicyclobacillus sp. ALC3]